MYNVNMTFIFLCILFVLLIIKIPFLISLGLAAIVCILLIIFGNGTKLSYKENELKKKDALKSEKDLNKFIDEYKAEVARLINKPNECKDYVSKRAREIELSGKIYGLVKLSTLWGGDERLKNAIPEAKCKGSPYEATIFKYNNIEISEDKYKKDIFGNENDSNGYQDIEVKVDDKVVYKASANFSDWASYVSERLNAKVEIFKPGKWIFTIYELYKKMVNEKIKEQTREIENKKKIIKENYLQ